MRYGLCDGWELAPQWSGEFAAGEGTAQAVRLPHTNQEVSIP